MKVGKMIKAVIFDIGKVMVDFVWEDYLAQKGFTEEKKEIRKEQKKKQESVLSDLAHFMEDVHKTVDADSEEIDEIQKMIDAMRGGRT